jgi:hypothetical protein
VIGSSNACAVRGRRLRGQRRHDPVRPRLSFTYSRDYDALENAARSLRIGIWQADTETPGLPGKALRFGASGRARQPLLD